MLKLEIVNRSKLKKIDSPQFEKAIKNIFKKFLKLALKKRLRHKALLNKKTLTLVFLPSTEMKKINKQFRNKNKPTDVLSFSGVETHSLGELLFCVEVLNRQASEQKHTLGCELTYMLIHGFLHLLGYDHETSTQEEKIMFSLQDRLFDELTASKINLDYL